MSLDAIIVLNKILIVYNKHIKVKESSQLIGQPLLTLILLLYYLLCSKNIKDTTCLFCHTFEGVWLFYNPVIPPWNSSLPLNLKLIGFSIVFLGQPLCMDGSRAMGGGGGGMRGSRKFCQTFFFLFLFFFNSTKDSAHKCQINDVPLAGR